MPDSPETVEVAIAATTPARPPSLVDYVMSNKAQASGLGVLGVLGMALTGYITITTPEEQACQIELADKSARLELLEEAKEACKSALDSLMAIEDSP
jgi:hypothetical protein